MIRKLIQLSPSTAVVSLPSKWIEKNKLIKGNSLFVEENENKLVIYSSNAKNEKEVSFDVSKLRGKLTWAIVDAAYISGYDSMVFTTRDQKQTDLFTRIIRYFPGMIIYDEREKLVHLKEIADGTNLDLNKILSRIFNLTISLLEDGITELKKENWDFLNKIKKRDCVINSYISLGQRHINKFGYSTFSKGGVMHSYIKILEMLADKICLLYISIGKNKPKHTKETYFLEKIANLFKEYHRLHFRFKIEKLVSIEEIREKTKEELLQTNTSFHFREIFELLYDLQELEMQLHI